MGTLLTWRDAAAEGDMDAADPAKVRSEVASACLAGSPDGSLHAASLWAEDCQSSQLGRRVAACEADEAEREEA